MCDVQDFTNQVLDRLGEFPKEEEPYILNCIQRCHADGFSVSDATAYVRLTEHYNPNLSETTACKRMTAIASKYRSPKTRYKKLS